MAHLYAQMSATRKMVYQDIRFKGSREEMERKKAQSAMFYVGNLAYTTQEEQMYELFSKAGLVKRVIMGLDRHRRTPCGFCFIEYYKRDDALRAIACFSGFKLDGRIIRCEIDAGFTQGRQFGRGKTGAQVRDDVKRGYTRRRPGRDGGGGGRYGGDRRRGGEYQPRKYRRYSGGRGGRDGDRDGDRGGDRDGDRRYGRGRY